MDPFHLALPVHDLSAARRFYEGLLCCSVGRTAERWIDFNFFGHQLSVHLVDGHEPAAPTNAVDGEQVPARHFGVVLNLESWAELRDRLSASGVDFLIEPQIRFEGEAGEQATMFVCDPSGNALEFKAIQNLDRLFATDID